MTRSRPEFRRQESWRYKRVHENWRRPRGVTSKMRKEESGFPAKVKVGYGSASESRGHHPRGLVEKIVWRESELDALDPKVHIVRIARRVGERKRLGIVAKSKERNFHIANPGKEESRPVAETPEVGEKSLPAEKEAVAKEPEGEAETVTAEEEQPSTEETSE
jgi:large subunit ribosomal protein L32e